MRLGDHIGKGLWATADKSLPALYGIAFMFLVIRRLPAAEFGLYALLQAAFLTASGLTTTFAYTPLVRFIFEDGKRPGVKGGAVSLHAAFVLVFLSFFLPLAPLLGKLFHSAGFVALAPYVAYLCLATFGRILAYQICLADLRVRSMFVMNLVYFGSMVAGLIVWIHRGRLEGAVDVLRINLAGEALSTIAGLLLIRKDLMLGWKFSWAETRRMLAVGKYSMSGGITTLLYSRIDVFMISSFLGPVEVAVYSSAQIFTRVYGLYRQIVGTLYAPVVSKLRARGEHDEIRVVYEKSVVFSLLLMVVPLVTFLAGAPLLFKIFYGEKYPAGVGLLQTFAFLSLVVPWQAISGYTVMQVGLPKRVFQARVVGFSTNLALNLLWIPLLGPRGAILATLSASLVEAGWLVLEVRRLIGFTARGLLGRCGDAAAFVRKRLRL